MTRQKQRRITVTARSAPEPSKGPVLYTHADGTQELLGPSGKSYPLSAEPIELSLEDSTAFWEHGMTAIIEGRSGGTAILPKEEDDAE